MESEEKRGIQEETEKRRRRGEKNGVKEGMTRNRVKEGYSTQGWPVGTQTQYLWMFISPPVLREAHIFHLGIAGQQARRSSASYRAGRVTETLTCMRENVAEAWVLISFCLCVMSLNPNQRSFPVRLLYIITDPKLNISKRQEKALKRPASDSGGRRWDGAK